MLIILEGVDCAGKTTLAHRLAANLGNAEIIHRGPPEDHPLNEYELALDHYIPGVGQNIVLDRWHLGADVYGPLKRGKSQLSDEDRWHIEAYLLARGALLVLVEPPSAETMLHRMHTRGETYVDDVEALQVLKNFRPVWQTSMVPGVRYVTEENTSIEELLSIGELLENDSAPLAPYPSYIGSPYAHTLLLGDVGNTNLAGEMAAPFKAAFAPFTGTSGKYLLEALHPDHTFGVANSGEVNIKGLWRTLRGPKIVALGREAEARVKAVGLECVHTQHPQYRRRFMYDQQDDYGRTIRCA